MHLPERGKVLERMEDTTTVQQPSIVKIGCTHPAEPEPESNASSGDVAVVEFKSVSKWFDDQRDGARIKALENLNLSIGHDEAGVFLVLLGPSGCGKSTILNLISGLALADAGEVRVFGERVTGPSIYSATVPQAYTCFPWLTVRENVEFGLMLQNKPREVAEEYLNRVGLGDRLNARPKQLSGGMQQRVAIARTLAIKPKIVLMDEPFGALDAQTRADMQQMLVDLWIEEKNTIIFVTHDINEALLLADRIVVFPSRPAGKFRDLRVNFARPRRPTLAREEEFMKLSESLLGLLKTGSTSEPLNVSIGKESTVIEEGEHE